MNTRTQRLAHFDDFLPALQRVQEQPPSPLGRRLLWAVLALVAATIAWATLARLDVVAVADGKLVPAGYLKIVQPTEQGVVKEILVREGQAVREGEVLMHMDAAISEAEGRALATNYHALRLGLRSRALYPALLEALAAETGMRVEFWRQGTIGVAFTAADAALLAAFKASKKDAEASKRRAQIEEEWAAKAKANYAKAIELAGAVK